MSEITTQVGLRECRIASPHYTSHLSILLYFDETNLLDRWTQQQEILDRAAIDINTHFSEFDTYVPSVLLIVTWSEVGYYREKSDKVS